MKDELDLPRLRRLVLDYNLPLTHIARRAKTTPQSIKRIMRDDTAAIDLYDIALRVMNIILIMIKERQIRFGVGHAKCEPYHRKWDKQQYELEKRCKKSKIRP